MSSLLPLCIALGPSHFWWYSLLHCCCATQQALEATCILQEGTEHQDVLTWMVILHEADLARAALQIMSTCAGKYLGEHPMSYSTKSVTLGVFLWLRQAGNMDLLCNEVSTIR